MKRIVWSLLIGLLLLSLAAFGVVGWIGSERALRPGYPHYKWNLATFPDLHPETILAIAADKITLSGRFFRGNRPSLIILASGYGDTQDQMLPIAEFLHQAGFGVV